MSRGHRESVGSRPSPNGRSDGQPVRARTAIVLVMLWCGAIAGFAAATSYPLALALLFVAGFLNLAYNSMAQTLVQLQAPEEIRGRVIGLYNTSSLGLRSISGITVGVGGAFIGIHWSLALSAAALFLVTVALLPYTLRATPGEATNRR